MRNETRIKFNAYVSQIALLSGVPSATEMFTVDPVVEQRLEEVIKEGSEFLQSIQIVPVMQQVGDKVGVGVTRPLASRTNTSGAGRRTPTDPTDTTDRGQYFCKQTNFDYAMKYAKIDIWRHKAEFQTLIRNAIAKQQGRDRIMIGFNGTSAAATTDLVANPKLQDVNLGWLHQIRTNAPTRVFDDGGLTANPTKAIYVHADGDTTPITGSVDYKTLDALVFDSVERVDEWHRDDTEMVVIVGRDLVHDKYFPIIEKAGNTATEMEAVDRIIRSSKQIGGLPAVRVPFFPANALLITRLDNLSIYVQEGTRRRMLKDEPEADQIANYESVNEAYVVEDYGMCALVENIVLTEKP